MLILDSQILVEDSTIDGVFNRWPAGVVRGCTTGPSLAALAT
jgi:hypothetical protein